MELSHPGNACEFPCEGQQCEVVMTSEIVSPISVVGLAEPRLTGVIGEGKLTPSAI